MHNNQHPNVTQTDLMGETLYRHQKPRRSVYLESADGYFSASPNYTRVAPAPVHFKGPLNKQNNGIIYETLKPILLLVKIIGVFPIANVAPGIFKVTPQLMGYSAAIFIFVTGYIGYIKWDKVEMVRSAEGRFEEAVIDYLFTVYLIPIIVNPIVWYESRKLANVITDWVYFEKLYNKITKKKMSLFLGNKPLIITIALPVLACAIMIVTHMTMVHFRAIQVSLALDF